MIILDIFQPQSTTIDHNQIILVDFRHFPTTIKHNLIILVDFRHFSTTIDHNQIILVNLRHFPTTIDHNQRTKNQPHRPKLWLKNVENQPILSDCGWLWSFVFEKYLKLSKIIRLWLIDHNQPQSSTIDHNQPKLWLKNV